MTKLFSISEPVIPNDSGGHTVDLWAEGYVANGNQSSAIFYGKYNAQSLSEAVLQFKEQLNEQDQSLIDLDSLTFWGCRFFDNENDARKIFG